MNFTLTLGETCILLLAIALFILLLYCISLVRHLIPSVKSLAKVMKDVEVISESAANSTQAAETVVTDVMDVTSSLVSSVKARTGLLGQVSSIALAVKSILELLSNRGADADSDADNDAETSDSSDSEDKQ